MSSMNNQNTDQTIHSSFDKREASTDSFSEQDKQQLIDFFALLLEWDLEEKEKEKGN